MNLISKILKIKKEIENDPTLTSLIRNGTIEYIAQSAERGYENFSIFCYYPNEKAWTLDKDYMVLLEYADDGTYRFVSIIDYADFLWLNLDISKDAAELRELIFLDRTLKNLKPGILTCIGHCADAYRLWLFQYKSAYVLLGDLGNGNYSFYKEVKDPADVPVDS